MRKTRKSVHNTYARCGAWVAADTASVLSQLPMPDFVKPDEFSKGQKAKNAQRNNERDDTYQYSSEAHARAAKRHARSRTQSADWGGIDQAIISALIAAISSGGGMVTFGYSRDGGAYYIGLFDNGERDTMYLRPSEDVEGELRNLAEDFGAKFDD